MKKNVLTWGKYEAYRFEELGGLSAPPPLDRYVINI